MSHPAPRVLLADDYEDMLTTFEWLLEHSCTIVGRVGDSQSLVDTARRLRPDVIIADLFMRPGNGLDACRDLKALLPDTKVILVSADDDPAIRTEAMRAGASAFVSKIRAAEELLPAVLKAAGV